MSFRAVRHVVAILFCSWLVADSAPAATRIELKIDEAIPNRSVPWPVTTGVPFPKSGLTEERHCRLVDDRGQEQLLQTKVAATWNAARSSIRWLTIDFIAEPGRSYALEFGDDVERSSFGPTLQIVDGDETTVTTVPLRVAFAKTGPSALLAIDRDLNGDGQFAADERIATGPTDGDHAYRTAADGVFSSDGDGADREIVVESRGPVRACVRVDGWYTGPGGERIIRYRTRYHLFAGLPVVKLIDEFRIVDSTKETKFQDIALPLDLQLGGTDREVRGKLDDSDIALHWVGFKRGGRLGQETFPHYGNQESKSYVEWTAGTDGGEVPLNPPSPPPGRRVSPWLQVSGERAAVTGSLRWLVEQFPKEWKATGDRLTLHLWSPHVEPLDFGAAGLRSFFGPAGEKYLLDWKPPGSRTPITDYFYFAGQQTMERDGADGRGINKHHEIWYHFGRADEAKAGQEYGALADAQPLCLASGEWNVGTGVFGPLAARPNDSPYEAIVDKIFELERYAQDAFGDYGWYLFGAGPHYSYQWDPETKRHFADPRRFEYHTYQRETQLWWCYLRSGERKFYDWCFPSENHWVDIAASHVPTKYSTVWRGGAPGEATLTFPAGDWSIDSPLHYVRQHDQGEAWLRSASQFWGTYHRTLETTTLAYYLTGDERYNDVVQFWQDYWSPLAGVRSDMPDGGLATHREQMWWQPTQSGEPSKSWAEMIRDYAPFQSGSRHQQTLFFNLATLYEHTWDPNVKQVLDEYAAAFLDPDALNGVWQCQDHRLPANADSPMLAHYWAPALWKYARATGDPRMPEVLRKYFTAAIEADPYGCDVGVYSNNQIAWGWWFTKDPRFLVAAKHELDALLPHAEPLARPEDLNRRIYNPYAPIKCLAAVPRLIGILHDAELSGITPPQTPPLSPQRTLIALRQKPGERLQATLWGWDPGVTVVDEGGATCSTPRDLVEHRSPRHPFDRVLPGYRVVQSDVEVPAESAVRWRYLSPKVETGLLKLAGNDAVFCWAGEPVQLEPQQRWYWRRPAGVDSLSLESVLVPQLQVSHGDQPLTGVVVQKRVTYRLDDLPGDALLTIAMTGERPIWFRIADASVAGAWVAPTAFAAADLPPESSATLVASRTSAPLDPQHTFVPGKFGQGLLVVAGRDLHIPDEITLPDGTVRRLSDEKQGTLEFWIRRLWDDRVAPGPTRFEPLSAGSIFAYCPTSNLKHGDWTHVAIVWRPMPDGSDGSLVHAYFDGVDYAFYRSLYWEGYSSKPTVFRGAKPWLKEFVARAAPTGPFVLDDVRISTEPRYVDLELDFGRQQTFNPDSFTPPTNPAMRDTSTVLLLPFDGDLRGTAVDGTPLEARIEEKSR